MTILSANLRINVQNRLDVILARRKLAQAFDRVPENRWVDDRGCAGLQRIYVQTIKRHRTAVRTRLQPRLDSIIFRNRHKDAPGDRIIIKTGRIRNLESNLRHSRGPG